MSKGVPADCPSAAIKAALTTIPRDVQTSKGPPPGRAASATVYSQPLSPTGTGGRTLFTPAASTVNRRTCPDTQPAITQPDGIGATATPLTFVPASGPGRNVSSSVVLLAVSRLGARPGTKASCR